MSNWLVLSRRARWPLVAALSAWLLVFLLATWWWDSVSGKRTGHQNQQQALLSTRALLQEKQRDWADVERLAPLAKALASQGVWGVPDRAAWIQAIQALQAQIPGGQTLGYALAAPRAAPSSSDAAGSQAGMDGQTVGPVQVFWHDLNLSWTGPDEERLWQFTRSAAQSVPGRFRVESCEIKRESETLLNHQCLWRFVSLQAPVGVPMGVGAGAADDAASAPSGLGGAVRELAASAWAAAQKLPLPAGASSAPKGPETLGPESLKPLTVAPQPTLFPLRPLGTLLLSSREREQIRQGGTPQTLATGAAVAPPPPEQRTIIGFIARAGQPPQVWEAGGDGIPRAQPGFSGPYSAAVNAPAAKPSAGDGGTLSTGDPEPASVPAGDACGPWLWRGRPVDAGDRLNLNDQTVNRSLPPGAVVRGAESRLSGSEPSGAVLHMPSGSSRPLNCRNPK
jgi:hypothetical protein